jgi:serine protease Do
MTGARLILAACLVAAAGARAATPTSELQSRVRAATFEVIVPKPAETGVSYERPPPYELEPYTERNDKFWPIGTAFAIGPDTFISAGHVIQGAVGGMGGAPQLRDAAGRTYTIDRVLKYSMHQDFAVFTAAVHAPQILATNTNTRLDEPVFAVGNALGEGIVIRDGLLTSLTPEDQDGRWKWLRYSAATSPGNSGGPLLNAEGEVIGVVIGKSPSENLNYALPIEHVLNAPDQARVDMRVPLRVPMLRDSIVAKYDITIPLPLPIADFDRRLREELLKDFQAERSRLLTEYDAQLLPRGKSEKLFASVDSAVCPMFITQSEDRTWAIDENRSNTVELPDDGKACTRGSAGMDTFSIDRGPSADPKFFAERRAAMDMVLKAVGLKRNFGTEAVTVTSLGPPVSDVEYRDRFGRRWRLAAFAAPYLDAHVVVMFLPTPNGYAGFVQLAARGMLEAASEQMRFASDYFYVTYLGTLPQWQLFLSRPDLRPAALDHVNFSRDAAGLHFHSRRIDFAVPPALIELGDASTMYLQMSYSLEAGATTWDVGAIYVNKDRDEKAYVAFIRQPKPGDGAGKEATDRWSEMLESRGAFSPERGHDSDYKKLWRRAAVGAGYVPGGKVDRNAALLYEVYSSLDDAKLPTRIDNMQDLLLENVRVKER